MIDEYLIEVVKEFARQVKQHYEPKAIYLYGSQIKGTAHQYSDIDIAFVFAPMNVHRKLNVLSDLLSIAAKFDANIEPNVLIDDGEYCRFSFLAEVMETGMLIEV
jgi:predicted nucleotidyltransferase